MTQQQSNIPTPTNIQECLTIQAHFVGIPNITKKNHLEFFRRGKALEIIGVSWVTKEVDSSLKDNEGRMPTLKEVESNIGIVKTNAPHFDKKSWKNELYQMIEMGTEELIKVEEDKDERDKAITDD
tara:strand:+ start:1888 stop:2265 length:378 start_codon:yes stop_codon:yes gene_type:complete